MININLLHLNKQSNSDISDLISLDLKNSWIWIKDGHIQSVQGFFDSLNYFFHQSSFQSELKDRITVLVKETDKANFVFLRLNKEVLKELFFNRLYFLDAQSFDRSTMKKEGNLERLLKEKREHSSETYDTLTGRNFNETTNEAKFALKLGVKPKLANSGSSGTYFVKDRFGVSLGIFKPTDEGPHGKNNPRLIYQLFKKHTYSFSRRYGIKSDELHITETASSKMSRNLRLNITPYTEIIELKSEDFSGKEKEKEGSFQLFVKGKEAGEVISIPWYFEYIPRILSIWIINHVDSLHQRFESRTPSNFEDLALFDFLGLNNDRKFDNWFITEDNKAIAIDNANAMPTKQFRGFHSLNPFKLFLNYLDTRNLFYWEILPQAAVPFSKEKKQFILSLTPERCLASLNSLMDRAKNDKQIEHMTQRNDTLTTRLRALQKLVSQDSPLRQICHILKDKKRTAVHSLQDKENPLAQIQSKKSLYSHK